MTGRRWILLAGLYLAGVLAMLGSSVTDEDEDGGSSVPTIIAFTITTNAMETLDIRRGATPSEPFNVLISNLRLAGEFEKQSGDLILNTDALELDESSFIVFELSGEITGTGRMDITQTYRRETENNPEPDFGQYSVVFEGATTTLTAQGGDGALIDTPANSGLSFSWPDLEDEINDSGTDVNVRVAALMESLMIFIVDLAELSESVQRSFVDNANLLEFRGVGDPLDIACLNANDGGEDKLIWTLDTNNNDVPDSGDEFERLFRNCQDTAIRYFEGAVSIDEYSFDESTSLRNLGMTAEYDGLRILRDPFTLGLPTTDENPEADGTLRYRYDQVAGLTP